MDPRRTNRMVMSTSPGIAPVLMDRVTGSQAACIEDALSVEEPLEIRLTADVGGHRTSQPVALTMRTPGNDGELAAGFLFTEAIIHSANEIEEVCNDRANVVQLTARRGVAVDLQALERHSFVSSSCGVCGKRALA